MDGATPGGPGTLRWMLPPKALRALKTEEVAPLPMRALVVINPIAGKGRKTTVGACTDLAKSVLAAHGYETEVRVTGGPDDAFRFAREAVENRADLVIAWGGDGTVNGAASGVAESGIAFAIVPGGSGNGLARDLSIPFNPVRRARDRRPAARPARSMPAICTARCSSTSPASASTRASPIAWRCRARGAACSAT